MDSIAQWISFLLCIVTLVFAIIWMKRRPSKAAWAAPIVLFMLHSIVFYIILLFPHNKLDAMGINQWAATKNVHGYITFAIYWVAKAYGLLGNGGK